MNQGIKRRLRKWAITIVVIYIAGGVLLYLCQELLLFHGQPLPMNHKFLFKEKFEEYNVTVGHDHLNIIHFPTDSIKRGVVLFFHGNMQNVEHYRQYPLFFLRNGYEVWTLDYPGFGKTTGKRTEQRMYSDALRMYEMAVKKTTQNHIIIYGKSMGTGVASYLASVSSCSRLILETPYYNVDALARHYFPVFPVVPMTKYSFPTNQNLKKIKAPVTLFHGTDDEVIPYRQAQNLKAENKGIELVTIEKGKHNNLWTFEVFQQKLDELLSGKQHAKK